MIWCKSHTYTKHGEWESKGWWQLNLSSAATIGYPIHEQWFHHEPPFRKGKGFVDGGWIEGEDFSKNLLLPKSYSSAGHKAR